MSTGFEDGDGALEAFLAAEGAAALGKAEPAHLWSEGREVGEWVVTGFLARGGSAETYCAKHRRLGTAAALKVLWRDGEGPRIRFDRETAFLMGDPGEAFPAFYGAGVEEGRPWVAMELLDECPLPGTDEGAARYLEEVGRGVAALHARGWLHRDLKPRNILRRADGRAVLVDFGLLKAIGTNETQVERESPSVVEGREVGVGTPGHSAPEQFAGGGATPVSDVYALGMLAEECFGGKPPRAWEGIIRRATGALPRQRYADVEAMLRAIRHRHRGRNGRRAAVVVAGAALVAAAVWAGRGVGGGIGVRWARAAAVWHAERGPGKAIVGEMIRDLVPLPGGADAADGEAEPAKFIGRHEVTQTQWEALMEGNPSRFRGADLPVDSVSVAECLEFLGRLNRMPETKAAGLAFRLPTKAEWYRAAAGGPRQLDSSEMYREEKAWRKLGWFRGNAGGATHPVGQKPPSKAGLFDLWGNVAEPTMSVARGERFSEDKVWFYWFCCMGGSVRKAVPSVDTDGIRSIGGDVGSVPGEFQAMFDGLEIPKRSQRRLAPDDDGRLTYVGELLGLRLFAERVAGQGR